MKTNLKTSALTALNLAAALFALATLPALAGSATWNNSGSTSWLTAANWNPNSSYPGTLGASGAAQSDVATFSGTAVSGNACGIGFSSAFLNMGAIFWNNAVGSAATIGNSTTTTTGTLQLNSASVNVGSTGGTIANLLVGIGDSATVDLTVQDANNGGNKTMGLALGASGTMYVTASRTLTISDKITGSFAITKSGAGTLKLSGGNTYSGGTTISVGTLKLGNGTALGNASGAVSVTGGAVLDLGGVSLNNANALTLNGTGISSGGALINSGGQPGIYPGLVTLGSASSIIATSGDIILANTGTITGSGNGLTVGGAKNTYISSIIGTVAGTLTKQDAGTLQLSGVNTYSGNTTINNGKVVGVTGGSCASSAVTVQSSGSGATASLGVLYTGANAQWTCSSLTTLAGTASGNAPNLAFGFATTPSASTAPLNVSGNVAFDASTTITVDPANLVSGQQYPLLVVGGTAPSSTPTVTIGRGLSGTVAWGGTGNKTLTLTVAGTSVEPIKWQPASATWSVGDATSNWKDAGGTAASYTEAVIGDQVLFDDTPGATATVTVNSGPRPASVTFNNSTCTYTFGNNGNGGIYGPATVTKTGTGTLNLSASRSAFTGGLVIKNGTVVAKTNPGQGIDFGGNGTGTITLGDAAGGPATLLGGWTSYSSPINLGANAVGPLSIGDSGEFAADAGGFKGAINLNGNNLNLIRVAQAYTAVFSIQSAISGTGSLTISNASTGGTAGGISFQSGGPLSFSGNITNASSGASGATTTINVVVGSGVTNIVQNSASLPLTVSGALTVNPATTLVNAGGALFTLSGGATGTGGLTLNNNSSTADAITVSTTAVNPTGGVTNSGSGSGEVLISSVLGTSVTTVVQNSATSNLKLRGVNTYTGDTLVSAGSLILDTTCTMASTNFVVGGGGTLDVSTETTALALGSTQKLKVSATGTSSTATINMAASKGLTLNATAGKGVEFTAFNGGSTAPLTLSGSGGSLALNGAPVTLSSASGLAAGPYTLIAHGSGGTALSGSPGAFSAGVGALATGASGVLSVNGSGDLQLSLYYSVTLTNNDGSGTTSTINATNGSTYGTLPTPTRTGYTFNGWFTASTGGTQVTSGTTVSITAPQTLYAQWTLSAVPPTKLVITAVPSGTTPAGNIFSVTVTAEDGSGVAQAVTSATGISLALASGSGTLGGTTTGTIANGGSAVTISGLTYTKAEAITLTASTTSGMSLTTSAASSSFTIVPNVASVANSTAVASPASLAADGTSASTVTVTLADAYNNLLGANTNVSWTVSGSANNVAPASSGTTTSGGVATFTVRSVKPEAKTVTVNVGATVITNSLQITFTTPGTANSFVWDPSNNGSGSDGAGTWDTSTANWANSSADFVWPNNGNDNATFGTNAALGANYTVTMGAPVTVSNLAFNTTGANQYTLSGAQTITLAGTTPTVSVAGAATIYSPLAGTAGLTKTGAGTLTLTNANAYSGTNAINAGTIQIAGTAQSPLGTGLIQVKTNGTLTFNYGANQDNFTNSISGGGTINQNGITTEVGLAGAISFSGQININSNKLALGQITGSFTGSVSGQPSVNVASGATLSVGPAFVVGTCSIGNLTGAGAVDTAFGSTTGTRTLSINQTVDGVFAGTLSDAGSRVLAVTKTGSAKLTLSASNSFSGGVVIKNGALAVYTNPGRQFALGGYGTNAITLGDAAGGPASLLLGWLGYNNPITLGAGAVGPLTIGDCLDDAGNNWPIVNGGINLNGNNLNVLKTVGTGNFAINGTAITGAGSLTLSNLNSTAVGTITITAPVNITGAITNIGTGTNATTISGNLASTVTAVVQNSATAPLILSGANTNSGGVYINAGTVTASGNTNALGGAAGNGMVYLGDTSGSANATLTFNYVLGGFANPITVQSGSSGNTLTISATGYTPLRGAITQNNPFTVYPVGGQTIAFNGQITGSSQITITNDTGTGAVVFNADNHATWTGPLVVKNGTFRTQGANALGANNTVQLYAGSTFDTYYANPNIAGLNDNSGAGGLVTNVSAGYTTTLTVGGSGTYSFAGIIGDGGGANKMALTMSGGGTQTLGGINTYSGATTISSGTLALGASGSINNSTGISVAAGATFDVSAIANYTLSGSTTLTASGAASAATIKGGTTVSLGSQGVTLNYDGSHVALTVSQGTLSLSGNQFKVVVPGAALTVGTNTLVSTPNAISGTVNPTPLYTGGNGVATGYTGVVSISGNSVILTVTANNYAVTFNSQGGTSETGITVTYGSTYGSLPTPTRTGYTFNGWNTVANGSGATITSSTPVTITSAQTLYAQWTINTFTITSSAGAHGAISPNGVTTVNYGGSQGYTITPDVNYNISDVLVDGSSVGAAGSYTFSGVLANHTISASFVLACSAPGIVGGVDASGTNLCAGSALILTLTNATGTAPLGYQWETNGTSILNATNASYTNSSASDTWAYACVVTNACGSVTSSVVTVTVHPTPSTGAITGTNLVTHATTHGYSVSATGGSSYGWSVPAGATYTGGLGNAISVTFGTTSGNVTVIETNVSGCTGSQQTLAVTVAANTAPVANVMNVLRTPGEMVLIALSDLATNWSDADGDLVRMTAFDGVTSNGMNLTPLYLTTTNDWTDTSYLTAAGGFLGYTNPANVNDQFTYSIGDGFGGTNVGYVNIVVSPFVAGTQTITGQQTTNSITGGSFTVTYYGIPGYTYLLERSTNLTTWADISTNTIGSGGVTNVIDNFSDLPGAPSAAYYRVGWKTSY